MGLIFMRGRTQVCEKRKVELGCKAKKEGSVACMVKPKFRKFRRRIEPPQLLVVPFRIKDVRSLFKQLESNDCLGIDCLKILKEILIQTEKSDLLEKVDEFKRRLILETLAGIQSCDQISVLQTFSYPFYLFEIYDNFSFSKLTRKCHCFKLQAVSSLQLLLIQPWKSWLKVRSAACYVIRHYIGP